MRAMKTLLLLPALLAALVTGCEPAEKAVAAEPAPTPSVATASPAAPKAGALANPAPVTNSPAASAAVAEAPAAPPELPAPVQDIVQLAQSTLGEQVLVDFVATIEKPFTLTAEHVVYLKDLGIPEPAIAALLKRQVELGGAAVELPPEAQLADASGTNAPAGPKLALTNAPGANVGLAAAPAPPPPPLPNAPTAGETPGTAPAPAPEPPATVNYNVFYNSLSPYGTWVEVSDYGWCWQPTVTRINVGWRPYSDNGRWVWSSSGWYWHSYYSWGWAPFHYGRWCNVAARGWCWVPGTVWGPSWVSWRHCDDHFGWAPLPPACGWSSGIGLTYHGSGVSLGFSFGLGANDFCFVPRSRFYDPHCYRFRASHHDLTGLYHRSTVVNNYVVNNNTVIINQGVGRDVVQKHTRDEIRPVALAEARRPVSAQSVALRAGRPTERLEVYRPALPANASTVASRPPATVLARQEARPTTFASRSTGTGLGNGIAAGRQSPAVIGRGQEIAPAGSRREARPGNVGTGNPNATTRPTAVTRRESPVAILPRGSQTAGRPTVTTAPGTSGAAQLHGRTETRPAGVAPATGNSTVSVSRPATGVRTETRPATMTPPGSTIGPSVVRQAPAPAPSRAEARPVPQQQVQVRRDTPAVQLQPTASGGSSYSRPDMTTRYTPAPVSRPRPSYTPAPAQPVAQPRYEARPQYQQPVQRSVPQAAPATRSYSAPVTASPGGGGDRSGGSRPALPRNQPQ